MRKGLILAWVAMLVAACGSRSAAPGDGGLPDPCACEAGSWRPRCSTAGVEHCVEGRWVLTKPCAEETFCVAMRVESVMPEPPDGVCLSPNAGCPDNVMGWNGAQRVAERFEAITVWDCVEGGASGTSVTFQEREWETRQRSVELRTFGCDDPTLPLEALNIAFGKEVTRTVSTTEDFIVRSKWLPANKVGQWYRQTSRIENIAVLRRGDEAVGLAILTDWIFTPLFSVGDTCPPPYPGEPLVPPKSCLLGDEGCDACE